MHNYFNNVYILKERMTSFLKRIKKSSKNSETKRIADSFSAVVDKYFENYGKIRNQHTHRIRYIYKDISRLETFEGYYSSSFNQPKTVKKSHVSMAYSEVKKAWLRFVETSNKSLIDFVSKYFDFILKLILPENGSFRILMPKYAYE